MSSNLLLMEPLGGSFGRFLPACRTSWCEGTFYTKGVTVGSRCTPQVVGTGGLGLPGSCFCLGWATEYILALCQSRASQSGLIGSYGLSLVRIAPDNWGLLSRCLFEERRVELELSSKGVWCMGVCRSCGLALHVSGMAPVVLRYIDSGSGLEFATWPLER